MTSTLQVRSQLFYLLQCLVLPTFSYPILTPSHQRSRILLAHPTPEPTIVSSLTLTWLLDIHRTPSDETDSEVS